MNLMFHLIIFLHSIARREQQHLDEYSNNHLNMNMFEANEKQRPNKVNTFASNKLKQQRRRRRERSIKALSLIFVFVVRLHDPNTHFDVHTLFQMLPAIETKKNGLDSVLFFFFILLFFRFERSFPLIVGVLLLLFRLYEWNISTNSNMHSCKRMRTTTSILGRTYNNNDRRMWR